MTWGLVAGKNHVIVRCDTDGVSALGLDGPVPLIKCCDRTAGSVAPPAVLTVQPPAEIDARPAVGQGATSVIYVPLAAPWGATGRR